MNEWQMVLTLLVFLCIFADLRHKLEKQKCRKLSKEEKATFFKKTELFISDMVRRSILVVKS